MRYLFGHFVLQSLYIDSQLLVVFLELSEQGITLLLSRLSCPSSSAHFLRVASTAVSYSSRVVIF